MKLGGKEARRLEGLEVVKRGGYEAGRPEGLEVIKHRR